MKTFLKPVALAVMLLIAGSSFSQTTKTVVHHAYHKHHKHHKHHKAAVHHMVHHVKKHEEAQAAH